MSARFYIRSLSLREAMDIMSVLPGQLSAIQQSDVRPDYDDYVISWPIDLNARAELSPLEAVSELRLQQKGATLALIGYPSEEDAGFRNFASIDARSLTEEPYRSQLRKTLERSLGFLYGLYKQVAGEAVAVLPASDTPAGKTWLN